MQGTVYDITRGKGLINVNKLQRILCMVLSAILLLTWMPAVAEEAPEAPEAAEATEAAEAAETEAEEEADIEVDFPDELIVGHPTITNGDH